MSDLYKNAVGHAYATACSTFEKNVTQTFNEKLGTNISNMVLDLTNEGASAPIGDEIYVNVKLSHIEGNLVRLYVQTDDVPELKESQYIDVDDKMYDQFSEVILGDHLFEQCDMGGDELNRTHIEKHSQLEFSNNDK